MDTKQSPKEKLTCIVDCSKGIFEALKLSRACSAAQPSSGSVAASADDFLPVFIFIILKANPPRLKSNINYITRFSCPSRLNSGEEGYFFTNMCCVVDFVEKLNADSLNLTEEEFSSYMSGADVPDGTNSIYMCEGLRLLHENSESITRLQQRQHQCVADIAELERRVAIFKLEYDEKINELVTNTPLNLKPRKTKVDMDVEAELPASLPLPLQPKPAVSPTAQK